jgi:hypothetical protein
MVAEYTNVPRGTRTTRTSDDGVKWLLVKPEQATAKGIPTAMKKLISAINS